MLNNYFVSVKEILNECEDLQMAYTLFILHKMKKGLRLGEDTDFPNCDL